MHGFKESITGGGALVVRGRDFLRGETYTSGVICKVKYLFALGKVPCKLLSCSKNYYQRSRGKGGGQNRLRVGQIKVSLPLVAQMLVV